ncbi:MAG: uroporphyrinogen decarboxylase family protein, partial [Actinomycetota bacterium]
IHFGVGCDHLLEAMYAAGPNVIGLDWRSSIADVRVRLGANTIVQGNLNPQLVLGTLDQAILGTDAVLADNAGHPGHIFNLGHGVQPSTNPEILTAVVRHVHEQTAAK